MDVESKRGYQRGRGKGWTETGPDIHTLLYTKENQEEAAQYSVMAHTGKGSKSGYMYTCNWFLSCVPETNTTISNKSTISNKN